MKLYNLEAISEKLIDSIEEILDEFGIKYTVYEGRVSFPCPIHGGDNPEGSSILTKGIGNWQCFTQKCHEEYGNINGASVIHFIQAWLSANQDKQVSFDSAVAWCAKLTGEKLKDVDYKEDKIKTKFIQLYKYATKKREHTTHFKTRQSVRQSLQIPAQYYIDRGYSPEILDRYDIGYCYDPNKSLFDRAIVPLYDDDGQYMVGCAGRSVYEQCGQCKLYHEAGRCPIGPKEKTSCVKWKNSGQFNASAYLYNYWAAKNEIKRLRTVLLVEGPGDIWRLEEAGIHIGLALLGTKFTDEQLIVLEQSGATNLIIATDNDEAGAKCRNNIRNRCDHMFNIYDFEPDHNDIGNNSVVNLNKKLLPLLEKIYD